MSRLFHQAIRYSFNTLLVSAVAALLSACGGEKSNPEDMSSDIATTTVIGAEGGVATSADGVVTLEVPAGASPVAASITIAKTGRKGLVGEAYEFGPKGASFTKPVRITFSYNRADLPTGIKESDLFVASTDTYLELLRDRRVDTAKQQITGTTTHFSSYEIGSFESTGVKTSDFNTVAVEFRMPIGHDEVDQDRGSNISLLGIQEWKNFKYPKISFNFGATSNRWYVATAFNSSRWLNNGWAEPSPASADETPCDSESIKSSVYSCKGSYHPGEDWNLDGKDLGKPIYAIAAGIVLFNQSQQSRAAATDAWKTDAFGNMLIIGHKLPDGKIIASVYAHMEKKSELLPGDVIEIGDRLGTIGTSGNVAAHLHFEITKKDGNLLEFDDDGSIKIPSTSTETAVKGWHWPGTDTDYISKNYEDPSKFILGTFIPGNLNASPGDRRVVLEWSAGAGVTYNLYMASVAGLTPEGFSLLPDGSLYAGVSSPYIVEELLNETTYHFIVETVIAGGKGPISAEIKATPRFTLDESILILSEQDGNWEIYSVRLDGTNPINITNNAAADRLPALSSQRDRIAFVSDRDGNNEIYLMRSDGTAISRLTSSSGDDVFPSWSPDGSKLAFISERDGNNELYVVEASGALLRRLTNTSADESMPTWSPDSQRILFVSRRDGNDEIYITNADGSGEAKNLTTSAAAENIPMFSPDGLWVSFVSDRDGTFDIWKIGAGGDNLQKITTATNNAVGWYAWSPDGQRIAFDSKMDGDYEIYVVNIDGSDLRQLTSNNAVDRFASWTWDGSKIVFISNLNGEDQVLALNPSDGTLVNVSNSLTNVALPMASPIYQTGGGCFIATAAYGSFLAPEVVTLRRFRDHHLLTNDLGRAFVKYYYDTSPAAAEIIARNGSLRQVTRIFLTPIILIVKYPYAALLVSVLLIMLGVRRQNGSVLLRRRSRSAGAGGRGPGCRIPRTRRARP